MKAHQDMFDRAAAWLLKADGTAVTRDNAINEENLALDVMELLDEVEKMRKDADENTSGAVCIIDDLRQQLATMTKARDEACSLLDDMVVQLRGDISEWFLRINALREAPKQHVVTPSSDGTGYRGRCTCGWTSNWFSRLEVLEPAVETHLRQVSTVHG